MKSLLASTLIFFSCSLLAQNKLSDRIFFGGGGGFNTSSAQTNISLSPQVGYKVTDRYLAGIGITYQYVKVKQPFDATLSNFGWSLFNQFIVTDQFFAHAEFERLTFEYLISAEQTATQGFNSLLIGAGYAEPFGGRASFNVTALYNVLYDESVDPRPYNSPWVIRAGVGIGMF
ncbi:MAG: hypothetical protein HRT61_08755 [Ekhidna sp.]|nr:hypothetical protein [Ekhidna sp.]